ncbi:MAG: hypothetical protein ACOZNI_19405 [Myxococcota bacterium]
MTPEARERLLGGGTDRLVDLLLDDLLERPVRELVDARWLAETLAKSFRGAADDPRVEQWFRDRVQDARARVPAGPVALPAEIRAPLRDVLRRPYVPDRKLVGELLDHDTARLLLKNLFQDLLIAFARRLKPPVPQQVRQQLPGLGLGRLKALGEGVMGVVGHELEAQVEQKAREFTEAGVARLVEKMADHMCNPELIAEYGEWRAHWLDVLLRTDARVLAGEVEKLDPDALVSTGAAVVRAFVARDDLAGELESVLSTVIDDAGDKSVRALMGGLEDHGIALVRDLLRQRARALVETEAFARWWDDMTGP